MYHVTSKNSSDLDRAQGARRPKLMSKVKSEEFCEVTTYNKAQLSSGSWDPDPSTRHTSVPIAGYTR